jgi:phenylalanine-4-hydroxylase
VAIQGQGQERHPHGYSTPIGKIKIADGQIKELSLLDTLEQHKLGLALGNNISLIYESGLVVQGVITNMSFTNENQVKLITFANCTVTSPTGEILFQPEWGEYDLIATGKISGAKLK